MRVLGRNDPCWCGSGRKLTAVTADGSRVAQFEHTLLVTDDGVALLTTPA